MVVHFFFTGLAALYRHWRFLVPGSNAAQRTQLNHSSRISLVHAVPTHWCGNNVTNRNTTDYRSKKIHLLSKQAQGEVPQTFKFQTKAAHERCPFYTTVPLHRTLLHWGSSNKSWVLYALKTDQPSKWMKSTSCPKNTIDNYSLKFLSTKLKLCHSVTIPVQVQR